MRLSLIVAIAACLMAAAVPLKAQTSNQGLNDTQKKEIDALIGEYLRAHPEVILESIRAMQEREQAAQLQRQQEGLVSRRQEIERDPTSPVIGNPNGTVTVTEFFDYRCGYCKAVFPSVLQLLKDDPNVRYVMKELPILTPESRIAARVAGLRSSRWRSNPVTNRFASSTG
mgnify:CR=1 FL=1